ncbi:MAG: amidohydrolase family protein [Candidatus Hermodarchaeota archaeon]
MRIDFHCHIFQNVITRKALSAFYSQFKGYGFYDRMIEKLFTLETLDSKNVVEKVIYHNKKVKVDKVILLPVNSKENISVMEWYDQAPELFIPFFNPPEKSIEGTDVKGIIENAINEKGYKGFKTMLSFRKKKLNDEILFPVLEVATEYKVPILMHSGYPPPGTKKDVLTYSNPIVIDEFINSFPKANIIIAHMGFPWTDIAIALATQYTNIYLDISNLAYMMPNHLKVLIIQAKEIMGLDKILFGSDGFLPEMVEIAINYFENADFLTKEEIKKILGLNAQKLLNLK